MSNQPNELVLLLIHALVKNKVMTQPPSDNAIAEPVWYPTAGRPRLDVMPRLDDLGALRDTLAALHQQVRASPDIPDERRATIITMIREIGELCSTKSTSTM